MGRIGRLLSFIRVVRNGAKLSDVKIDIGGGEVLTGEHVPPSGEDAHPLPDDQPVAIPVAQTGRIVILGYVETDAVQKAQAGEKRIYARNGDRVEVVELWLKADGSATLSNDNGSVSLAPDGSTTTTTPASTFECKADGAIEAVNGSGFFELRADGTIDLNGVIIDPSGNTNIPTSLTLNGKEIAEHNHSQGNDSAGNTEQATGPNN